MQTSYKWVVIYSSYFLLKYILWGEFIILLADKNETFDKFKKSSSENGVEFSVRFLIHFLIISFSQFSFEIFEDALVAGLT